MLRGKAAECVAIIGLSVGAEVFEKDAHDIMNVLISIYSEGMDADNTVRDYIQEAFSRLCRTLKDKFYPYLLHLMPSIIKTLSVTPDIFDEEKRAQVKVGSCRSLGFLLAVHVEHAALCLPLHP